MDSIPLVTIEYLEINKQPHIVLFTRENHTRQKIIIKNFRPYFYIPIEDHPNKVKGGEIKTFPTLFGETAGKVYTQTPGEVTNYRKMFTKTFEADVHFTTRYLIDRVPKIDKVDLRVHYTDIETDRDTDQIISIATYDNYLRKVVAFVWREDLTPKVLNTEYTFPSGYRFRASVHIYNSKVKMLADFIKFVRDTDPDVMTGWYFLDFDMPELIKRINKVKNLSAGWLSPMGKCYINKEDKYYLPPVTCKGRVLRDMLKDYKRLQPTELSEYSLEAVAQKELGEGKKKFEKPISWLWRNDIKTLIEYNCKDTVLVHRIDQKCKVLDYYDSLRRWVGCEWENLHSETQMWDAYILRKVKGKIVLPTKPQLDIPKIAGAKVFLPIKGVHEWIVLIDLRSLYPSIIVTFNLSPETIVRGKPKLGRPFYELTNGVRFYSDKKGIFPTILDEIVAERKRYKKEMAKYPYGTDEYNVYFHLQTAVKEMKNSLYGASIYKKFRLAAREIGSSTTFVGREIIEFVREQVEKLGCKVLAGDTDSVFYFSNKRTLPEIIEEMNNIVKEINVNIKKLIESLGGDKNKSQIEIEPQKIYRYFLMYLKKDKSGEAAKKNYWGRIFWNEGKTVDKIEMKGEGRKSHHSRLTRNLYKGVGRCLLRLEPYENLKTYIREARNRLEEPKLDFDFIGIPRGIGQDLNSYKTDNPWVRGSKWSNEFLGTKIGIGDKPKLLYVRSVSGDYPKTDAVCFLSTVDLPEGIVLDSEKMFEKSVFMKLEQVLDAADLNFDEIYYGYDQTKLMDY